MTVLNRTEHKTRKGVFWLCRCDCGKEVIVAGGHLRTRHTKSCGCIKDEIPNPLKTHGFSNTRLYVVWCNMKSRCNNPNSSYYKEYGERGIKVCEEWENNFLTFRKWAYENGYDENANHGECTIDRIDVNSNYEPSNCRWADKITQANNKRNNYIIEYNGTRKTIHEWARETGVTVSCIRNRIEAGWDLEKVFSTPSLNAKKIYEFNGETHSIREWSEISGLHIDCLRGRLEAGWSIEKALTIKDTTKYIEFNGEKKTAKAWAKEYGIGYGCLRYRLQSGWDIEKALTTPSMRADKTTQKAV